jgi:hypothetical protein
MVYSVVDSDTTVEEIYSHLQALGIVPGSQFRHFYFTYRGRRIRWDDTMGALGTGPLSHLHIVVSLPGGATSGAFLVLYPFS